MNTLVWRRLDEPGMEVAHVRSLSSASGVQIGATYEVRWHLEDEHLELELNGERRASFGLDGADFFAVRKLGDLISSTRMLGLASSVT